MGHSLSLQRSGRSSQEIFDQIKRQPSVFESSRRTWRHDECLVRYVIQQRYRIISARQFTQFVIRILGRLIGNPVFFLTCSAHAKNHDLLVNNTRRRAEAIDGFVAKVRCQDLPAIVNAIKWNDHDQHAARLQPAKELLEKYRLHALVFAFSNFEIVGRVEI